MTNLIIQVSKYLIIILMALYTLQCYTVFGKKDEDAREYLFLRQNTKSAESLGHKAIGSAK